MKPDMPHPRDTSVCAYFQRRLRGPRELEYYWHIDIQVDEPEDTQELPS